MNAAFRLAAALLVFAACARDRTPDAVATETKDARERPAAFGERTADRDRMVDRQLAAREVRDPRVLDAMRTVPRHAFVPAGLRASAYEDRPLPIGQDQTISQPYVVAIMTEAIDLEPGERVLEIGTGSGYQAAVLAEITPHVWTIEIVEELAQRARSTLESLGYDTIEFRIGDGWHGWPESAPFDAILVTAAPDEVPAALIEQLAPGGRLCMPVGASAADQELLVVEKDDSGTVTRRSLGPVRFVPMTGEAERRR